MRKSGVNHLVLNACLSARIDDDEHNNLTAQLVKQGLATVVAMSYKVSVEAATMFMNAFYLTLSTSRNIPLSVASGRSYLKQHSERQARYGERVKCEDDCVPVLYCSHMSCSNASDEAPIQTTTFSSAENIALQPVQCEHIQEGTPTTVVHSLHESQCRDLDILSIEELLENRAVLIVSGPAGSGKTTFANYLLHWWKETNYVNHAYYTHFITDREWLTGLALPRIQTEIESLATDIAESWHNYDSIHLIDFFMPFECFFNDADITERSKNVFEALVETLKTKPRSRLLFFACAEPAFLQQYLRVPVYELEMPRMPEVNKMIDYYLKDRSPEQDLDREGRIDLEAIMGSSWRNVSFIRGTVLSMTQLQLSFTQLSYGLLRPTTSTLASDVARAFLDVRVHKSEYGEADTPFACFSSWMHNMYEANEMVYWLALSFVVFQQHLPAKVDLWTWELLYCGYLQPGGTPANDYEPAWLPSAEDLDGTDTPLDLCWAATCTALQNFGMLRRVRMPSTNSKAELPEYEVHPFLCLASRNEILKQRHRPPQQVLQTLRSALAHFYQRDTGLLAHSKDSETVQFELEIGKRIQMEENNIINALETSELEHRVGHEFGFLQMILIAYLPVLTMTKPHLRKWAGVFESLLSRYERLQSDCSEVLDLPPSVRIMVIYRIASLMWHYVEICKILDRGSKRLDIAIRTLKIIEIFKNDILDQATAAVLSYNFDLICLKEPHAAGALARAADLLLFDPQKSLDQSCLLGEVKTLTKTFVMRAKMTFLTELLTSGTWPTRDPVLAGPIETAGKACRIFLEPSGQEKLVEEYVAATFNVISRGSETDRLRLSRAGDSMASTTGADAPSILTNLSSQLRIHRYATLLESNPGDLKGKAGLEASYERALQSHDFVLQADALDKLLTHAFSRRNFTDAEVLHGRVEKMMHDRFQAGAISETVLTVQRARRFLLLSYILVDPERPMDQVKHGDALLAEAYASAAEDMLSYCNSKAARRLLPWACDLQANIAMSGPRWDDDEEFSDAQLRRMLNFCVYGSRAARFAYLDGEISALPWLRDYLLMSYLYGFWQVTINVSTVWAFHGLVHVVKKLVRKPWVPGVDLSRLEASVWEDVISVAVNWEPARIRRLMQQIDASLCGVIHIYDPKNLTAEQMSFLREAQQILLDPESESQQYRYWKQDRRKDWRSNFEKRWRWINYQHISAQGNGLKAWLMWCILLFACWKW